MRTTPTVPQPTQTVDDQLTPKSAQPLDRGVSLIEIIVGITLMTTVVVAVLSAVAVTVKATSYQRDQAKAQQWLQASIGVIESINFSSCNPLNIDGNKVRVDYQAAVDSKAQKPWEYDGNLTIGVPEVWNGSKFVPFTSQIACYDQSRLRQQLVTMVVTHPNGIQESVEMIKVDR